MSRAFDRDRIRRFYNRFGARQDSQGFYEEPALEALVAAAGFGESRSVLELGCGTGKLAERLLAWELPKGARYLGLEISETMVGLAAARLAPWPGRAAVRLTDGGPDLARFGGPFDRVVATYVFDLMSAAQIAAALEGVHAVLEPGGWLGTAGLTRGTGPGSRVVSALWRLVHGVAPMLVGGCRPLVLADCLGPGRWRQRHRQVVVAWGVPSEVIVAEAV